MKPYTNTGLNINENYEISSIKFSLIDEILQNYPSINLYKFSQPF